MRYTGTVEVRGWHEKGAIAVPLGGTKGVRRCIVVSHDLLRALGTEMNTAIAFYRGVSDFTVTRWRLALGLDGRKTKGFLAAMSEIGSNTGNLPGQADHLRSLNQRPWTPDELALLLNYSTAEVADRLGRTLEAVQHARCLHRIFQVRRPLTCATCGHVWLPRTVRKPQRCPKYGCRHPLTLTLPLAE